MVASELSDFLNVNFLHLKIMGIWPGKTLSRQYKYYSTLFVAINLFIYNILMILNLVFTPRKIETMIWALIFLFNEVAITSKVLMILLNRKKLFAAFDILNCDAFKGDDEAGERIIARHVSNYKTYWKVYALLSNFAYFAEAFLPLFVSLITKTNVELPVYEYYFLDDETIQRYFSFWFIYQAFGMFTHMMYNVNIDTLIAGLLLMAISQVQVLKHELRNLKVTKNKNSCDLNDDAIQIVRLHKYLNHYEELLNYCTLVQDILGVAMFIQFGMGSVIICVVLCGLLLPAPIDAFVFMVSYLFAMLLQIFVPAWLGTQLDYESQELVSAAYCSEWIPRSERFKRSLKLFMERANTNIVITGWQIFPLSLDTFTSILKTAYSFFTLIKNVQD